MLTLGTRGFSQDLIETGNRARKVSGTEGIGVVVKEQNHFVQFLNKGSMVESYFNSA